MKKKFDDLVILAAHLRSPEGCPWDREQSLKTIKPFIIEEAYEVVEALDSKDVDELVEELGDLLFQIIFAGQIASEQGKFDIDFIINELHAKLVRRHPHVFGEVKANNAEEAIKSWQTEKLKEKKRKKTLLEIPQSMPALMRAQRVGEKAASVGFDWESLAGVLDKVEEELKELKQEINNKNTTAIKQEWGDLIFSLVNLARHLQIDAETAVTSAVNKFIARFAAVEQKAKEQGKQLAELSLKEMDDLWDKVKSE